MKFHRIPGLALAAAMAVATLAARADDLPARPRGVVELFTSQGCSSCPRADSFLGELAQRGDVVALGFHVDYWDYLGWSDTLASPGNTRRQSDYAAALGLRSVYTPQMVINGRVHVKGSSRAEVEAALADLDGAGKGMAIDVGIRRGPDSIIVETGAATHGRGKANVLLVFFEPRTPVVIGRGENAGKTIVYWNAVAAVQAAGLWHGQPTRLEIPDTELRKKGSRGCAVLLQSMRKDGTPGPIIGAAILDSPSS